MRGELLYRQVFSYCKGLNETADYADDADFEESRWELFLYPRKSAKSAVNFRLRLRC
jgi:hypothetical protein